MIKPFRLINTLELNTLTSHFSPVLQHWSDEYAMASCTLQLTLPPENYSPANIVHIRSGDGALAMIEAHYSEVMNHILFGEHKSCFNSVSQELLLILLNDLFKVDNCIVEDNIHKSPPNWFYKGSTCLLLTLSTEQNGVTIIINPDWVYQTFPLGKSVSTNFSSLDEALGDQLLNINLELLPFHLPINQLINIQVGDVIATDHSLATPLRVMQENQVLAHAELGQSAHYKSILLKRFS